MNESLFSDLRQSLMYEMRQSLIKEHLLIHGMTSPEPGKSRPENHITKIFITHSGDYHLDDLFSYCVLKKVYPNHTLIRTRDESLIVPSSNTIIFDVGGYYDVEKQVYDHHMKDGPSRHVDKIGSVPYSSAGLIWYFYGKNYLRKLGIPEYFVRAIWENLEETFVVPIDLNDNGLEKDHPLSLALMIEAVQRKENPDSFEKTAEFLESYLNTLVEVKYKQEMSKNMIEELFLESSKKNSDFVIVPEDSPAATEVSYNFPDIFYLIRDKKSSEDPVMIQAIATRKDPMSPKKPFPVSWRGLRNTDLEKETTLPGMVFCHHSGFLMGVDSLETAEKILQKLREN